jgi:hypothetical protein
MKMEFSHLLLYDIKNYFHFRESGRQDKTSWEIEFMSCFPHSWATILALVTPVDKFRIKP